MRLDARIVDTSMCIVLCLLCCPGRGFSVTIRLVLAPAWNRLIELLNHHFVIIVSIAPCTRGTIYLRYTSNPSQEELDLTLNLILKMYSQYNRSQNAEKIGAKHRSV